MAAHYGSLLRMAKVFIWPTALRAYTSKVSRRVLSLPLRVVSHFANVRSTPASWRRDVLGPFKRLILGDAPIPDSLPVFGVHSFEQLEAELSNFRDILDRLVRLKASNVDEARDLAQLITEGSRLRMRRFAIDRKTRLLVPRWDSETQSFNEMLYAHLALTFCQVPIHRLRRCAACNHFFFSTSGQKAKYCTGRCQIRAAMQRYRTRRGRRTAKTP